MSDHDLLQRYAREASQAAFAELVARHVNLVYSAARRQVRLPQLAEEVAQSVFLDLARCARELPPGQPLAAWLHVVTRRNAIDAIRRESRRQAREQTAAELAAMKTPASAWSHIEPLLDEAVAALPDVDRSAILLRFFENKSLREIGESLGTSEDAAQKRVSRALDQLRAFFLRRGVPLTAAGLAADLSANALLTAPVALLTTISASVATTLPAITASSTTIVVMTTLQKTLAALAAAVLAGLGLYEASMIRHQRLEVSALRASGNEPVAASSRTPPLPAATAATPPVSGAGNSQPSPDQRVALLRQLFAELPAQRLPELKLLDEADWLAIAQKHELDSAADIRVALADLRAIARRKIATTLQDALRDYTAASGGQLPTDIAQLAPFLAAPADAEMLARYDLVRTGKLGEPAEKLVREKATSDLILSVGLDSCDLTNNSALPAAFGESNADALDRVARALGTAMGDDPAEKSEITASIHALAASVEGAMKKLEPVFGDHAAFDEAMERAVAGFLAAHPGETAANVAQVLPFLKDAEKFVAAFRPVLAHLDYVREHDGQLPASPVQLQPYLARPFSAADAFREMKLVREGGRIAVDIDLPGKP